MELKDFVKQTIIEITEGIRDGDKFIRENKLGVGVDDRQGKEINFDIAVSTNEELTSGLKGGISVAQIFNVGANTKESNMSSNQSRIQFRIFIHLDLKKDE